MRGAVEEGGVVMELRDALTQITEIRSRLAFAEVYRGYRALPVAFSGVIALVAGLVQASYMGDPAQSPGVYLMLWVGAAILSMLIAGIEMWVRARREDSRISRASTWVAIQQFSPALAAGALITIIVPRIAPASVWMLPGLWQILYSLGIFASGRLLPRPTYWVAVFYLFAGCLVLALGPGRALEPSCMAVPFAVGQFLAAVVLYSTLERDHVWE